MTQGYQSVIVGVFRLWYDPKEVDLSDKDVVEAINGFSDGAALIEPDPDDGYDMMIYREKEGIRIGY